MDVTGAQSVKLVDSVVAPLEQVSEQGEQGAEPAARSWPEAASTPGIGRDVGEVLLELPWPEGGASGTLPTPSEAPPVGGSPEALAAYVVDPITDSVADQTA